MLRTTVDWNRHRMVIVDNASTDYQAELAIHAFREQVYGVKLARNTKNIGTARGFNLGHAMLHGDHTLKIDDDVEVHEDGWLDTMQLALERVPDLGGVSLKWRMLSESPGRKYIPQEVRHFWSQERETRLEFVPREQMHEWWTPIEYGLFMSGMCALYRKEALGQIGMMYQPKLYGHDDVLQCKRLVAAGWRIAFLPAIKTDHIDDTNTEYSQWKRDEAGHTFESGIWARLEEQIKNGEWYSSDGESLCTPL